MALSTLIKQFDFDSIEEYYEYILDCISKSERAQARHLYHAMNKGERSEFFDWVETSHFYEDDHVDEWMHNLRMFFDEPSVWDMYLDEDGERFPNE
jgi:erythromycin esterase-like protein